VAHVLDQMDFQWESEQNTGKYDSSILRVRKRDIAFSPTIEFKAKYCDIGFNKEKNLIAIKATEYGKHVRRKRAECTIGAKVFIEKYANSGLYKITKSTKDFIIAKAIESEAIR